MADEEIGDLAFQNIIKAAVLNNSWSLQKFIDNFNVSGGTISRWTRGKSLPLPGARPAIISWLKEQEGLIE